MVIKSVTDPLIAILNESLASLGLSCIPKLFKIAKIFLMYKNGNTVDPQIYRPIFLPCFTEMLEKLMHICLTLFLQKNNILNKLHHGLRSSPFYTYMYSRY